MANAGSITSPFTKCGACHSFVNDYSNIFTDDNNGVKNSDYDIQGGVIYYGLDFTALKDLDNVRVTGFEISIKGGRYNTSYGSKTRLFFEAVTDFPTSGTSTTGCTNICGKSYTVVTGSVAPTTVHTFTHEDLPELLSWLQTAEGLQNLIDGYNENTFGIRFLLLYAQVKYFTMTVTYEQVEGGVKNIYRATTKQTAYKGTSDKLSVYKGTKKIYG